MKLKRYIEFIKESPTYTSEIDDMDEILNYIAENIPSEDIPILKMEIMPLKESVLNEGVFDNIKNRLTRWFDDRIFKYLINKKRDFYLKLIGKLDIFDLTTISDIEKNFPGFELESLYISGGMDKAKDTGAGWRLRLEYEFEVENPGKSYNKPPVKVANESGNIIEVSPAYVVDGNDLNIYVKEGNKFLKGNYDTPALLNPLRKEMDRTKNPLFGQEMKKFKSGEYQDTKDPRSFDVLNNIFSGIIEPDDEHIVRHCSATFLGFNEVASGGTFAELEDLSLLRKPIFVWYLDGWEIHGHSPWNLPHLSKMMRSEEDMKTFVKTLVDYKK